MLRLLDKCSCDSCYGIGFLLEACNIFVKESLLSELYKLSIIHVFMCLQNISSLANATRFLHFLKEMCDSMKFIVSIRFDDLVLSSVAEILSGDKSERIQIGKSY